MSRNRRRRHQRYTEAQGKSSPLSDAVNSLDHAEDAHWTKTGQPDCNVLTESCGFKVSRKMVNEQYPDLKRNG